MAYPQCALCGGHRYFSTQAVTEARGEVSCLRCLLPLGPASLSSLFLFRDEGMSWGAPYLPTTRRHASLLLPPPPHAYGQASFRGQNSGPVRGFHTLVWTALGLGFYEQAENVARIFCGCRPSVPALLTSLFLINWAGWRFADCPPPQSGALTPFPSPVLPSTQAPQDSGRGQAWA